MAIKFYNIRSKEIIVADSEPKISAFWSSGDRGPNANGGQDFGWRLAPEVAIELKRIKKDLNLLQNIANNMRKPVEEIDEKDLLKYISDKTDVENAPVAVESDYEDEYESEVRRLELKLLRSEEKDLDERVASAKMEAIELGINIEPYKDNYGLLKAAITRFKNKNNLSDL